MLSRVRIARYGTRRINDFAQWNKRIFAETISLENVQYKVPNPGFLEKERHPRSMRKHWLERMQIYNDMAVISIIVETFGWGTV